jgi:hypothetical protein
MNPSTAPATALVVMRPNPTHPKSSLTRSDLLEEIEEKLICQPMSPIFRFPSLEQRFLDSVLLASRPAISRTYHADLTKLTSTNGVATSGCTNTAQAAEDSAVQITGFQQFLEILTVPDNIPIIAMMILVMFFTYIALKQARRNDQLIEHGHRERIIDEMRK